MRISIVGGGIGGLTAALALHQRGLDVTVYEQAPALKELGAGVQISPNGTRVLHELGLEEAVNAVAAEPTGKEVRLWNTGRTWKLFDLGPVARERYGYPYVMLHRNDLFQVLAHAFESSCPGGIRLAHSCIGAEEIGEEVELTFANGTKARSDLVIGADGVHSVIRHALFGSDAPRFSGIVAWRGLIPTERLPEHLVRSVGTNWIGPGGHVIHYPLRGGKLLNYVSVIERSDWQVESWSVAGTIEEALNDYAGWHEDVHALIRATGTPYKWALMLRPPLQQWSKGRITLLGDACHSTLPFLAQGANMAMEDGLVLARALELHGGDHNTAFATYEAARVERTSAIVRGSERNIERFHNPRLADEAGAVEYVNQQWEENRVMERYDWLFRYDAANVALEAAA